MSIRNRWLLLLAAAVVVAVALLRPHGSTGQGSTHAAVSPNTSGITTISIGPQALRTGVRRFGINLSGQSFYDSSQMLRNLVARNPGFEGEIWQSILRCKVTTPSSCTEENQYTQWPAGFLDGAGFEVISGGGEGAKGVVLNSTAATPPNGITLRFAPLPHPLQPGDFLVVRKAMPGDPVAGWWPDLHGGASFSAERTDLSPHTSGTQALRMEAVKPGQTATVNSFFDSTEGHSFVHLHDSSTLRFRAKPSGGNGVLHIALARLDVVHGRQQFFGNDLKLTTGWNDYTFTFPTQEEASAVGTMGLQFTVSGAAILLDDVSLIDTHPGDHQNTAFRDEVVQTLRDLHPGLLRYMDSGAGFGSSLDNLLAPEFARQRAGYSTQETKREDIPIGLEDFLELCSAVEADPWITLPAGLSSEEAGHLIEFLTGPVSAPYGARRAKLGRALPWVQAFRTVHLELGNEQWNSRSFTGGTVHDPTAYGHRAAAVFGVMRQSPGFEPSRFDLIAGTWSAVPWWTGQELAAAGNIDTLAIAPYLFAEFNDASTLEAIYGSMFAEPEQLDSRANAANNTVTQQAVELRKASHPVHLAVYEVNLGSMSGSATQAELDSTVPSWGGGLAVADHMLLMLRDQGIATQALFCLPEFRNFFTNTAGGGQETMPLWGAVVDMGGATNRKRPTYLALQAVNRAILPTMLATNLTGANPTWDQPLSKNDKIELRGAHELQTFAFTDGAELSLILLNLSRTQAHTVQLAATSAPAGPVKETLLAAEHLSDGNEAAETVRPVTTTLPAGRAAGPFSLPPGSMTVLRWPVPAGSPR